MSEVDECEDCPARPGESHCDHWWDGEECCACKAPASPPDEHDRPQGETVNTENAPCLHSGEPSCSHAPECPGEVPPPPPVTGYRQLSREEVALMNDVKAAFNRVGDLLAKMGADFAGDGAPVEAYRALGLAKDHAQTAAMWACRAITRPTSFA